MAGRQRTRLAAAGMAVLIVAGCGPVDDEGVAAERQQVLNAQFVNLLDGLAPCMNDGLEQSEIGELNAHDLGWDMGEELYAAYRSAMEDCQ